MKLIEEDGYLASRVVNALWPGPAYFYPGVWGHTHIGFPLEIVEPRSGGISYPQLGSRLEENGFPDTRSSP
jgi:hypothetical protein